MIETVTGDILSLKKGILVHGCNCQGVMGGGIAKLIRDKWNEVYVYYKRHHKTVGLVLGDIVPVHSRGYHGAAQAMRHLRNAADNLPAELVVVNAMTQEVYGNDPSVVYVDYQAIFAAFARVNLIALDTGLDVHFPLIGCGLANGDWTIVSQMISAAMDKSVRLVLWKLP